MISGEVNNRRATENGRRRDDVAIRLELVRLGTALDFHLKECSENWLRVEGFMTKVILVTIGSAGGIISFLAYLAFKVH